jgi:hypothetical protein
MISRLKIPKLVRWIFFTGIIFLSVMTLLRVVFYFYFPDHGNGLKDIVSSFILGFRFDLREVCILCLLLLVLGSISFLNPFEKKLGNKIARTIVLLTVFLLIFFYSVDFAHYSYLSQRLNASVLNYLGDAATSSKMVWQSYPVIKILILLIVTTWVIYRVISARLRKIANSNKNYKEKQSHMVYYLPVGIWFWYIRQTRSVPTPVERCLCTWKRL